jgi:hypothetical protein
MINENLAGVSDCVREILLYNTAEQRHEVIGFIVKLSTPSLTQVHTLGKPFYTVEQQHNSIYTFSQPIPNFLYGC